MEKLIIQSKQLADESKVIRIDGESAAILDTLAAKSGRPIGFLASEAVKFAAKYIEIQTVSVDFKVEGVNDESSH